MTDHGRCRRRAVTRARTARRSARGLRDPPRIWILDFACLVIATKGSNWAVRLSALSLLNLAINYTFRVWVMTGD